MGLIENPTIPISGNGGIFPPNPEKYNENRFYDYLSEFKKEWVFDKNEYPDNPDSWNSKTIRYFAHHIVYSPLVKPNTEFYDNKDIIQLPYYLFELIKENVIPLLTDLAKKYKTRTTDKVIVLGNDLNEEIIKIPYFTRFSEDYEKMVKKKFIKEIEPILRTYKVFHFLTITVDPKQHLSIGGAKDFIRKLENKIMTRLRKRFGDRIFYISVMEHQKNGYPHLHILIAGLSWIPNDWLRLTEELKDPHINIIKQEYLHNYNYKHAMNYILKYITKNINGNDTDSFIQKVIQWAEFSRSFSTSRINNQLNLKSGMINSNEKMDQIEWYVLGIVKMDPEIEKISTKNDFLYYLYGPMT